MVVTLYAPSFSFRHLCWRKAAANRGLDGGFFVSSSPAFRFSSATTQIGMLMFSLNWAEVHSSSVDPRSLSFKSAPDGRKRLGLVSLLSVGGLIETRVPPLRDLR